MFLYAVVDSDSEYTRLQALIVEAGQPPRGSGGGDIRQHFINSDYPTNTSNLKL